MPTPTPLRAVYDAFLQRMATDDWDALEQSEAESDWMGLLQMAIGQFMFPANSLAIVGAAFEGELDPKEILLLAAYMKVEWLRRSIHSWENVKPLYEERDFSPANTLDKLNKTLQAEFSYVRSLEERYYRSRRWLPFDYTRLAGRGGRQ